MKRSTLIDIIASLFILLFVYTALSKLYEPGKFKWALAKSPLLGHFSALIAWLLPAIELVIAIFLFIPGKWQISLWKSFSMNVWFRKLGLYGSFILMSVFTGYLAYMVAFAPKLPCTCGGIIQQLTWRQHIIFNMAFTLLAWTGIQMQKKETKIQREKIQNMIFT